MNNAVAVRNVGGARRSFQVTVGVTSWVASGGSKPPPAPPRHYEDPAFPNKTAVACRELLGLCSTRSPWDALTWASGDYEFTVVADAGATVGETNEGDNTGTTVMNVP
jgi:hypothetical protein